MWVGYFQMFEFNKVCGFGEQHTKSVATISAHQGGGFRNPSALIHKHFTASNLQISHRDGSI